MKLLCDDWSGGIVTRIRPDKLGELAFSGNVGKAGKFSTDILDADIFGQAVVSQNAHVATSQPLTDRLGYQNKTGTRSTVKWGEHWYWSDNDDGSLNSSLGYMGVAAPAHEMRASPSGTGNRMVGVYRYYVTFETRDGFESSYRTPGDDVRKLAVNCRRLEPITLQGLDELEEFDPWHPTEIASNAGYPAGARVKKDDRAYEAIVDIWSSKNKAITGSQFPDYEGQTVWRDITSAYSGQTTEVYNGYEHVLLSNLPVPTQSYVTKLNLYRTTADGEVFYKLASVSAGTATFDDRILDADLMLGYLLDLDEPADEPVYQYKERAWSKQVGRYLTEMNSVFYLAVGDRVYLSMPGNPHSWPTSRYIVLDEDVTGIARDDDGVLAFTKNSTYSITGSTIANIRSRRLPVQQGCRNWRTISYLRDAPVWLSNDGLCRWTFEPQMQAKTLRVVSRDLADIPTGELYAVAASDVYWVIYADGTAWCADLREGIRLYRRTVPVSSKADYDAENDRVMLVDPSDNRYILDQGDRQQFTVVSPQFTPTSRRCSIIRSVWIDADCDVSVSFTRDGVADAAVTSAGSVPRRLFVGKRARTLQVTVSGTGELKSYEIEIV